MQIKWIFEDLKPGQIRGPVATSEDGNYQIVFDFYDFNKIYYYLYRNSNCIYGYEVDSGFEFSDFLVKCHRKIERLNNYYHLDQLSDLECTVKVKDNASTCGNCKHLIFKQYRDREGMCSILRLYRRFEDPCYYEEEMQ